MISLATPIAGRTMMYTARRLSRPEQVLGQQRVATVDRIDTPIWRAGYTPVVPLPAAALREASAGRRFSALAFLRSWLGREARPNLTKKSALFLDGGRSRSSLLPQRLQS